jgi:hypothetical protein
MRRKAPGLTKKGSSFSVAARDGGLCFFHANPNKASEMGRIGAGLIGITMYLPSPGDPLPDLTSVTAVSDTVIRLITDVYTGKLHPRIAAGLAPLMHLQFKALEKTELGQRIARVEKRLSEAKKQA